MNKRTVSISDFGAVSNDGKLQTAAIQSAIDYCFKQGGGEVQIPQGNYLTGDIRIRSNTTLHLMENAVLTGSRNPEDYFNYINDSVEPLRPEQITSAPYVHVTQIENETEYVENREEYTYKRRPGSRWNNAVIRAIDAVNIAVIGEKGSVIDGANCFDEQGEELYRGPHGMTLFNCSEIFLGGYTIQNTGNWAHNLLFCKNIRVNGIKALAGHDGFDAAVCTNLEISDSEFYTGDDCIAGYANINVHVHDCVLNSSCNALRFAGRNVFVEHCHIYGPGRYSFRYVLNDEEKRNGAPSPTSGGRRNLLSAFSYYGDYSLPIRVRPGNIVISDCKIDSADRFLNYNFSGRAAFQKQRALGSIEFRNIDATGINMPLIAYGDPEDRFDLKLENVRIAMREGHKNEAVIHAKNFNSIILRNINIEDFNGKCVIRKWSDGDIIAEGISDEKIVVSENGEGDFFAQFI